MIDATGRIRPSNHLDIFLDLAKAEIVVLGSSRFSTNDFVREFASTGEGRGPTDPENSNAPAGSRPVSGGAD